MHIAGARAREIARIESFCRDAAAGSGGLVLMTGEAGIGKSWLARFAAECAQSLGMGLARGWCMDDPTAPPLWLWRRVARDVPGLADALAVFETTDGAAEARVRLGDAAGSRIAQVARRSGLCIVLEDLQWADELSLDLLHRVLPELQALPVAVVATARDDALEDTAFGQVMGRIVRSSATTHLPLAGLTVGEVATLLAADDHTSGWAARAAELTEITGGNPFYVTSLAVELSGSPDVEIEAALQRHPTWRLVLIGARDELPEEARRSIDVAAILGERLAPVIVAAAVGRPVAEVAEHLRGGVRVGLLHFGETGLAFRHSLVREAVMASLTKESLSEGHAGAAAALEATGDPRLAGLAAAHWSKVPGREAAQRCLALASEAADSTRFAPDRAVDLARMAVEASRALDVSAGELAQRMVVLARLQWAAGDIHPALATCTSGIEIAEKARRPELMADFALVPQGMGDPRLAVATAALNSRALAELSTTDVPRRARLLAQAAVITVELRQPNLDGSPPGAAPPVADPGPLSAEALELAESTGDPDAELEALAARHYTLSYPSALDARAALADRAVQLGPSAASVMGALWGLLWQADLAFQRGQLGEVRRIRSAIADIADRRLSPVARWHALRLDGALAVLDGRFDDTRRHAAAARRIADAMGETSMIGMHHALHVELALLRGDPGEVLPGWRELILSVPPMPLIRISLVIMQALEGDVESARTQLEPFRALVRRFPLGPRWFGTVGQIGRAAILVEDADLARTCYMLLLPGAGWCAGDGGGSPFAGGSTELRLGELARTMREPALAVQHFHRAIAVDDRLPAPPFAALARIGLARCLAESDPRRAATLARLALATFSRLDQPGHARDAEAFLAGLERREVLTTTTTLPSLTERETDVARLVAEALTNQQIAHRLVVSVRTVESHVRNILIKRGFSTRTEIALWVQSQT